MPDARDSGRPLGRENAHVKSFPVRPLRSVVLRGARASWPRGDGVLEAGRREARASEPRGGPRRGGGAPGDVQPRRKSRARRAEVAFAHLHVPRRHLVPGGDQGDDGARGPDGMRQDHAGASVLGGGGLVRRRAHGCVHSAAKGRRADDRRARRRGDGHPLGQDVGYAVRFENVCTPGTTKIQFCTDGVLLRELMDDPLLTKYGVVMVDEAHERSLATDALLGLLKKIQRRRPDLRVVIASATIKPRRSPSSSTRGTST